MTTEQPSTNGTNFFMMTPDGIPDEVISQEFIIERATELAVHLSANCDDRAELLAILNRLILEVRMPAFGFIASNAALLLATDHLDPILTAADAGGGTIRASMKAAYAEYLREGTSE